MAHEELQELFRVIRLRMKGEYKPQLDEVWTGDTEQNKVTLREEQQVENHLLHRNKCQLRQASATPFVDGYLGDLIDVDGSGEFADKIVSGGTMLEIEGMEPTVRRYIAGMAARDNSIPNSVQTDIILAEYRHFWKNKRETTATSPYGLHIGHYWSVLNIEAVDILDVQRMMLLIPFKYAIVPERWTKTVQILLEKDEGSMWSHRLCIIELFDAQINAGLQMIFGKRMVKNALKHYLLHDSAYSSVPGRTAQDTAMEKV